MNEIDLMAIAEYCRENFKKERVCDDSYLGTCFVGINEEGKLLISQTPHILKNAVEVLLIHEYLTCGITNYYRFYSVEYINFKGEVSQGMLDNGYTMTIDWTGSWKNQTMYLRKDNETVYFCKRPWEQTLQKFWNVYKACLNCKTISEAVVIGKLALQDDKIDKLMAENKELNYMKILLATEVEQYKNILNDIKKQLQNNS